MSASDITIHLLGPKGDGVHASRRGNIYVDRALPGDLLKARISKDRFGVSRGQIVEVVAPSPHRRTAPCPHYDQCGNCTLQHVEEKYYRQWKIQTVVDAFQRHRLRPASWLAPVFLGGASRRRINFTATKQQGKVTLGYFRRRSDEVTEIKSCLVAEPDLFSLREPIDFCMRTLLKEFQSVDIFLQKVGNVVEMLISHISGPMPEPKLTPLEQLLETTSIARIAWSQGYGKAATTLLEKSEPTVKFGPLEVVLPSGAFLQSTQKGEETLVSAVLEAVPAQGKFADLFSGCGTFTGPLLTRGTVEAYEADKRAVKALTKAGKRFALKVIERDLFTNPLKKKELEGFDAVVFDPPRGGCIEQAGTLGQSSVPTLVGISCNPATFARDARLICDGGYRLQSLRVVDQFVWSHHVEVVGVFTKGEAT